MPGRSPTPGPPAPSSAVEPTGASTMTRSAARRRRSTADVEAVDARGVAGRHGHRRLGRDAAERREVGHQPQDARAGRRRSPTARRCRGSRGRARRARPRAPQRGERRPAVAAVDDLDRHVRCRPRRSMSRSDMDVVPPLMWPTMCGSRLEHGVGGDRARARDRRARPCGYVTVIPCCLGPGDHRRRLARPSSREPRPISPTSVDAGGAPSRRSRAPRPARARGSARRRGPSPRRAGSCAYALAATIASAFSPTMSFGRPGQVDLTGRDDRRHAAVQPRFDEVHRPLARREVAERRDGRASRSGRA